MKIHNPIDRTSGISCRTSIYSMLMLVISATITLSAAWVHGRSTNRWGVSQELIEHASTLDQIPERFGSWVKSDEAEFPSYLVKQLDLKGAVHRIYVHETTGQSVTLILMLGPAGELVRHPSEICYVNGKNRLIHSESLEIPLQHSIARLRLLAFESASAAANDFLVAYGFGDAGNWDHPQSPRLAYAGKPMIYKIQVLTESQVEPSVHDPRGMRDFVSSLLPVLNRRWIQE